MPKPVHDDDQPGLWSLPETTEGPTTKPRIVRNAAVASSTHENANQQPDPSPTTDIETLWRIDDLAAHLGVPKSTIYGWRTTNYGPPGIKVGKHLRWRPSKVVEWAATQECSATNS